MAIIVKVESSCGSDRVDCESRLAGVEGAKGDEALVIQVDCHLRANSQSHANLIWVLLS
jgi:hypothetical protein